MTSKQLGGGLANQMRALGYQVRPPADPEDCTAWTVHPPHSHEVFLAKDQAEGWKKANQHWHQQNLAKMKNLSAPSAPKALAAEDHKPGCSLSGVEPRISSCACFLPLAAEGADPVLVDVLSSILAAQQVNPYRGWNLTKLNKAVDRARELLGLPSVRDLNPDIAAMQDHASANKEGILAAISAITDPTLAREEGDEYRLMLLDLLAVIHRDGGHKTQEIGIKLAHEQAMRLSSERIYAREEGYRQGIEDAANLFDGPSKRFTTSGERWVANAIRALASKEQG